MAQNFEYPMFSPYSKAKLYKRFTGDIPVELKDKETITVEGNRYVLTGRFRWIESTAKQDQDEQPLDGLVVPNGYITVKTNSLMAFASGDVVELPEETRFGGLWIVTDGVSVECVYTPKPVQTYQYLPMSSVG